MHKFHDGVPSDPEEQVEHLSRLMYELRENRARLLEHYGMTHEEGLLELIRTGRLDEHPAYEHYLSIRILASARDTVRTELAELLKEVRQP